MSRLSVILSTFFQISERCRMYIFDRPMHFKYFSPCHVERFHRACGGAAVLLLFEHAPDCCIGMPWSLAVAPTAHCSPFMAGKVLLRLLDCFWSKRGHLLRLFIQQIFYHGMRSPSSQLMTLPVVCIDALIVSYSTRFAPTGGSTAPSMSQMCAYFCVIAVRLKPGCNN